MADTSEPISNVAGVRAELPMAVAVDGEFLSTGRTGKSVYSFPLHQVKVAVPPLVPAGIGTESFPLPSWILCDWPATLLAYCPICSGNQTVPAAERLHRIYGNA